MILIGQYDSPFVRRVGIALTLYGLSFEHRPWSVFGNAAEIRAYNPLVRVPTLVLGHGEVLIESHSILDYLDTLAPEGQALFPRSEPARHEALKIAALATGLSEKAVSLFYEQRLHREVSEVWVNRCRSQIADTLGALEALWADQSTRKIDHAGIAIAVMMRFLAEAHPGLVAIAGYPNLNAHAARMEALPAFQAIQQPFIAPA